MAKTKRISKLSEILGGIQKVQWINIESLGAELPLRPLSQTEISELEEREAKGYGDYTSESKSRNKGRRQVKGETFTKGKVNIYQQTKTTNEIKARAVSLSLDNPEFDKGDNTNIEEVVTSFDKVIFEEIYKNVREISGMDDEPEELNEEVENFP